MKILAFLPLILIITTSCSLSKKKEDKINWIFAYKAEAFSSCLKSSGAIIKNDYSNWLRYEILGREYQSLADSLGIKYSIVITEKSSYFKESDLEGGKAITNGCLIFYNNLDSSANVEYKKYKKTHK